MPKLLRSFKPLVDARSRILVLGTMPGPEALKRKEYYGFPGNHFWKIMAFLFNEGKELRTYAEKKALLKENRIALWDVLKSCQREGASDNAIRRACPTDIVRLVNKYKGIHSIFINGKSAEKLYKKYNGDRLKIAVFVLPSTSPAHASMSLTKKMERWSVIKNFLGNRNPWC